MAQGYRVVFYGDVLDGWDITKVKAGLAQLFKISEERVESMFGAGPTVLKKGVDEATAEKYRAALAKVGAAGRVEPMEPAAPELSLEPMAAPPPPPPAADAAPPPGPQPEPSATGPADPGTNYYAPPSTPLVRPHDEAEDGALGEPRKLSAGYGWSWLSRGFGYFMNSPGAWIGVIIIFVLMLMALAIVPLGIGQLASYLLMPIFMGGLMIGCRAIDRGDGLGVGDLFAAFKVQGGRLAGLGALYLVANLGVFLLVMALTFVFGGAAAGMQYFGMMSGGEAPGAGEAAAMFTAMALFVLTMLALMLPVLMGYWFAPVLIVLHDTGIWESVKLSFRGCLRNWLAFLVYGIIALVLSIIAAIPLGLGLLVVGPVVMASIYISHKDIFVH